MKNIVVILSFLAVAACGSHGTNSSPAVIPTPAEQGEKTTDPVTDPSNPLCDSAKTDIAVSACLSGRSAIDQARIRGTLEAWSYHSRLWTEDDLDRKTFQARYQLSADEIKCLKHNLCTESQNEDAN